MAFQVSPGVNVSEIDLTTIVPSVSTTAGAIGGLFRWGPIGQIQLVSSQVDLVTKYGKPTNFNAETFFTASNFLAYGNQLYVSRAANTTDLTISGNGTFTAIADSSGAIVANVAANTYWGANVSATFNILNSDDYNNKANAGSFASQSTYLYAAKYPGALGSSLGVSTIDSAAAYSSNLINIANTSFVNGSNTGTLNFNDANSTISSATVASNLASYAAWSALTVGDFITVGNVTTGTQTLQIASKGSAPVLVINSSASFGACTVVTGLTGMSNAYIGFVAQGPGIANGTTVVSTTGTTVTLSAAAAGSASGTLKLAQEYLNLSFYSPYTLSTSFTTPTGGNVGRLWQFYNSVVSAPASTQYIQQFGNTAATDEIDVVVYDSLGRFTGIPGQILEVFQGMSRATDAKTSDGQSNYYVNQVNQKSQYVWFTNHRGGSTYVANAALVNNTPSSTTPLSVQFAGGQDGFAETAVGTNIGVITNAFDQFKSAETAPISLILTGKSDDTNTTLLGNYLIQNIAQNRLDCVVFVSPNRSTVVNNVGNEYSSVIAFRNGLTSSSYGVLDSGYKYQYDKFNDVYRYIPLNGDIAGLCVYTDTTKDPWWSPAGFNRGQIKNVIKLAFNPSKAQRDALYPVGVNPVVTFPGQGTVLFGDKTLQAKPSAFDRINVRRLFIVLEKAIAAAAQYTMFEFNDAFTRAQFVSLVTPFLKDVQGRRGITDFKVVCDTTNNTQQVIDANQFVGDIYVKPARSINYIQLNFVAVRTGVDFTEIVGKF